MAAYTWQFNAQARSAQTATKYIITLNNTVNFLEKNTKKVDKAIKDNTRTTSAWSKSWTHMASVFNVWNKAARFAIDDIRLLGRGLTSIFRNTQQVGGAFEMASASLKGFLGADADKVIKLSASLGRRTKFSANQSAQGAIELSKGGMRGNDIIETLPAALQAAEANSISVGKAGTIAAVGMSQFTASGENALDILQLYTAAANSSTTSIEGIAAAAKNAAPVMSLLGMDAKTTATYIAILAKRGITFSRAGTMLRGGFERLASPVPKANAALKTLGISLKNIDIGDPVQLIDVFNKALLSVPTAAEKLALLKPIFGRSVTAILPILEEGSAAFLEMRDNIESGRSQMAEFQQLKMDTMIGSYLGFKSAVEGVWVALTGFLSLPIRTFWKMLADSINTVTDRLDVLGLRFGDNASSMQEWMAILRNGGFKGIFEGLTDEFDEELGQLKILAQALFESIGSLFVSLWSMVFPKVQNWFETKFPDGLQPAMDKAGNVLGQVLAEAIEVAAVATIENLPAIFVAAWKAEISMITNFWAGVFSKAMEIAKNMGRSEDAKKADVALESFRADQTAKSTQVGSRSWETGAGSAMARADQKAYEDAMRNYKPGQSLGKAEQYAIANGLTLDQAKRDLELQAYADDSRSRRAQSLSPKEQRSASRRQMLSAYRQQEALSNDPEAMQEKADKLQGQIDLNSQTKQYKETLEGANNALSEGKLKILEIGQNFAKYLLQPVNQFAQAWGNVTKQWDETMQSLKGKSVDIGEKFGLISGEQANKQRIGLAKEGLGITDQFIMGAQTAQERMTGQQQKADQLASLADMTGDKKYAEQAQQALQQAQQSAMEQKKIELEKIKIDRKATEASVPILQDMLQNSETAGGKASILGRLQENLMKMGKAQDAAYITKDLMKAEMQAAEENSKHMKLTAERLGILVELGKQQLEALGKTVTNTEGMEAQILDPAMQAA